MNRYERYLKSNPKTRQSKAGMRMMLAEVVPGEMFRFVASSFVRGTWVLEQFNGPSGTCVIRAIDRSGGAIDDHRQPTREIVELV